MEQYVIKGGNPLVGEVEIGGAKNAALPILAAVVMTDETVKIENIPDECIESCEIQVKYAGYIRREQQEAAKLQRLEQIRIPDTFNYNSIQSLSTEARQKLTRIRPRSIGEAQRIPGVSPNDISVLLVLMGR